MRVHLLALPNAQTTRDYSLDGFAMATIRFAQLLKGLGHTVYLYASEENEAPCDELITCVTKAEQETFLGDTPYPYAEMTAASPLFQSVNARMVTAIWVRKEPQDFLCLIGGIAQSAVAASHPDLICVEYSIGYPSSFSDYRVFESCAWQNSTYGRQGIERGRFFDTVIPCSFDPAEFPYGHRADDFVLYVGRLQPNKGIGIACDAAKAAGVDLKIIGHGDPSVITYGEYLGPLDMAERNSWMSRAQAVLCPTLYLEPFGCVAVESQLCGTPVISTDFGAFHETVVQGVTGYRCSYFGEFVQAILRAGELDRAAIRQRAVDTYSIAAVAPLYQAYFERLMLLWDKGWNTLGAA